MKYKYFYSDNTIYGNVVDIAEKLDINNKGVHLDTACGYAFKKLGIKFNENLSTAEDWNFLMRTAFITGVSNSDKVTSIYRIWNNSENSYSQHKSEEWIANEKLVKDYFNEIL